MQEPEEMSLARGFKEAFQDPFDDDEPIVAACDLENPEACESCQ